MEVILTESYNPNVPQIAVPLAEVHEIFEKAESAMEAVTEDEDEEEPPASLRMDALTGAEVVEVEVTEMEDNRSVPCDTENRGQFNGSDVLKRNVMDVKVTVIDVERINTPDSDSIELTDLVTEEEERG